MLTCQEKECLGWALLATDQFCSWCGSRLVELAVSWEARVGEHWVPLQPAVLNRARPPELRARIHHAGDAGTVTIGPDNVRMAVPWLGVDTASLPPTRLAPDESCYLLVNRLKVPGKEDSVQEAELQVSLGTLEASAVLEFVPSPQFHLDLVSTEVLLGPDAPGALDGAIVLTRGRVWLEERPRLEGGWGHLEASLEGSLPLELDARSRSRIPVRLTLSEEAAREIRESAGDKPEALVRKGAVKLCCRDRGSQGTRTEDALLLELPVELSFMLGPELYVEPFRDDVRLDWELVRGINDQKPRLLTLRNGAPGTGGRQELVVRSLEVEYQDSTEGWLTAQASQPLPWTIPGGGALELSLKVDPKQLPAGGSTARLVFVSNDQVARSYYLHASVTEPEEFPGWLVVDLGTSTTCASLVDENRTVSMVGLDAPVELHGDRVHPGQRPPSSLPSVVCYLQLKERVRYLVGTWAVERSAEPAAVRSVVAGAKRRVGDRSFSYAVVPLDEPAETVSKAPRDVLKDLYFHVVGKAMDQLGGAGRSDQLITRAVITHPSRFSMHQIDELKAAIGAAMRDRLKQVGVELRVEEPFTLHEPVGAALHHLNDWRSHAPLHDDKGQDELTYTLMVYDFGGGTLDITLLNIQSRRQLRPGSTPAPASPSKGLEEHLEELVRGRCQERLEKKLKATVVMPGRRDPRDEASESNAYVIEQFVRSVLQAVNGDLAASWATLPGNPHVNEKLLLTYYSEGKWNEHLFTREEALPTLDQVRELRPTAEPGDHPYSYSVQPTVMGATGHRWLGGEDVTYELAQMLVARLLHAVREMEPGEWTLPLESEELPFHQALAARRNGATLRRWAEELKLALSEGRETVSGFQTLTFFQGAKERVFTGSSLRRSLQLPTLAELEARVQPRIEETVALMNRLLERHALTQPDVLLRVGKASKLPVVDRVLKTAFPHVRYLAPAEAKECVVRGAATPALPGRVSSGIQISRGLDRPGVRVRLPRQQGLMATTSRLGIKVIEGGRTWFHELIGAGLAVPPEGLEVQLQGIILEPGLNLLPVLENAGHLDELVLENGHPNPDIEQLRVFEVHVPDDADPLDLEDVGLTVRLAADLALRLEVRIPGREPLTFDTIPSSDYGFNY